MECQGSTPLIPSDKLTVHPLSVGQTLKAAESRGRQHLQGVVSGMNGCGGRVLGVHKGRMQAGKGQVSHSKELVH